MNQRDPSSTNLSVPESFSDGGVPKWEWLSSLVAHSHHLMGVTDIHGRLLFVNQAGRSMLGLLESQSLDNTLIYNFFEVDGKATFDQVVLPTLAQNFQWTSETNLNPGRESEAFPVTCFAYAFPLGQLPTTEILWIVQDRRNRASLNMQISQRVQEHRVVAALAQEAIHVRWLDLLRHAVSAVANNLEAELVVIAQPIDNTDKLHIVAKFDSISLDLTVLAGGPGSQAGYAIASGQPIITPDISEEKRVDTTIVRGLGLNSGMAVPIFQDDQPWGALSIHTLSKRQYTTDDLAFLESIASVLSSAQKRISTEREIRHQSLHDSLTGLPNRSLMLDRIQHTIDTLKGSEHSASLLLLDLDDFKVLNDSLGHQSGDRLLEEVASRLTQLVDEGDTVARLGGDEFLILCENQESPMEALELSNRIRGSFKVPFQLEERSVFANASIGITFATADSEVVELVREVDTAMYQAKQAGVGEIKIYHQAMGEASQDRFQLASDLHDAIANEELRVAYQPIIELVSGEVVAVEALCRWDHPTRGSIGPDTFIKLAEQTGQIRSLGRWVLEKACREVKSLGSDHRRIALRVNVSAIQLQDKNFVAEVHHVLLTTGLSGNLLGLEITEGINLHPGEETFMRLSELRDLGVELLVDDYGIGYSSLSALLRFSQMSALKIDKEFIQMTLDQRHKSIIESMVSLGHAIGMKVVAEGVENEAQLQCVRMAGCDYAQGFMLGRPVSFSDLKAQLEFSEVIP
ncbi:MAG: EAL domain-containing protein [Actinobacteria bacterium]|nr:EAL domain-containing protein [Actinomycetota bacterium]